MEKLLANVVFEVLGRPKENVTEALQTMTVKLGAEKGVEILKKTIHEPVPAQDSESLFTSFAELEVEFDNLEIYLAMMFTYLPSNVEIVKPEKLQLDNAKLNDIGNAVIHKIHHYDSVTKKYIYERNFILNEVKKDAPKVYGRLMEISQQRNAAKDDSSQAS